MSAVECKISIAKGYRHGCSCLFRALCVRCRSLRLFWRCQVAGRLHVVACLFFLRRDFARRLRSARLASTRAAVLCRLPAQKLFSCNISWPAFKSLHRFAPCFAVVSDGCYAALAETSFSGCVVSSLLHVSQERRPLAVIFFGGHHYFCAGGSCSHLFSSFFAFL